MHIPSIKKITKSGTQYITIKKAIETDHGTNTGWNSDYGDGQAVFTASGGNVDIVAGTLDIAGNTTIDTGDVTVTAGDIDVTVGDVDVAAGDINVTLGDISVPAGHLGVGTAAKVGTIFQAASATTSNSPMFGIATHA